MPPPVLTAALLHLLRKNTELPPNTWYIIIAATLTILNRPDEIPQVYKYAIGPELGQVDSKLSQDEQLNISRRMREALIKLSAVGGVPKTINALLALKEVTPLEFQDPPLGNSPTSRRSDIYEAPPSEILQRGQNFFETVYGKVSERVLGQMDSSGTEDLGLVARLMYSHVLSNTSILNPAETSFVMIAGLIPQDVNPQLKGHLRGALNAGAKIEEVRAVRNVVVQICEFAGMIELKDTSASSGWGWREAVAIL